MSSQPPNKLFSWKKAILPAVAVIGVLAYRTYERYQKKGHLDSVDYVAAIVPLVMFVAIFTIVGWWANRPQ